MQGAEIVQTINSDPGLAIGMHKPIFILSPIHPAIITTILSYNCNVRHVNVITFTKVVTLPYFVLLKSASCVVSFAPRFEHVPIRNQCHKRRCHHCLCFHSCHCVMVYLCQSIGVM